MAPKRQLIDVEAAKGYVETFMADPILKMAANAVLNNAPRVDAAEVVHGRWIMRSPLNPDSNRYCSNCKADISALKSLYYKFCPYCGAKMDGDGNG